MRPALTTFLAAYAPNAIKRPPFTTLLDAHLRMWTLVTSPSTFRRMLHVHRSFANLPEVSLGTHFYGGISYLRGRKELAHMHGDGVLDAHVGTRRAEALRGIPGIEAHHAEGGPGWVTVDLRGEVDVDSAVSALLVGVNPEI